MIKGMRDRDYVTYGVEMRRARPWLAGATPRLHEYESWRVATDELLLVPRERA